MKSLIRILICFSLILAACTIPDAPLEEVKEEQAKEIIDPVPTIEYINSTIMHIPESMLREYITDSGTWRLTRGGIYQPTDCLLYANPVTSNSFLSGQYYLRGGETVEKTGEGYYLFFGEAWFIYKDREYYGDCSLEIKKTGSGIMLNEGTVK